MEFRLNESAPEGAKNLSREQVDLAFEFAKRLHKEFGTMLKAIVLFGSVTRPQPQEDPELQSGGMQQGDIDILVIVDDVTVKLAPEIVETYRIIVKKVVLDVSPKLHVTSLKLSSFWGYIRAGDPVGLNILREGVPLLDSGFFEPMKALLSRGLIRPSPESIFTYAARAPRTIDNSKWHILQACVDLYWAVIDAAHAALMAAGEIPPAPDNVAGLMRQKLLGRNGIPRHAPETVEKFFKLYKGITRREIREIPGGAYDAYLREASHFVAEMHRFISSRGFRIGA